MPHRLILTVCAVLLGIAAVVRAEPRVYYQENFRNYGETVSFAAHAGQYRIDNDPIWTQSASAVFTPAEDGLVLKHFMPADAPKDLRSYDVLFHFRFAGKGERFEMRLRAGDGEIKIAFTPAAVSVSGVGLNVEGKLPTAIPPSQWRQCVLSVRDGALTVHLTDEMRGFHNVCHAKIPAMSLVGINFFGFKDQPFAITDIVIRDSGPMPDHSVRRMLPSPITDTSGYTTGAQHPSHVVKANDLFGATVRTGDEGLKIEIARADGTKNELALKAVATRGRFNEIDSSRRKAENLPLPDAIIQIAGLPGFKRPFEYHVRPMLRRYFTSYSYTDAYYDIVRDWNLLPGAAEYPLKVEFRHALNGTELYLNGCLATTFEGPAVSGVTFSLSPTASIKDLFSTKARVDVTRFFPLDVAAQHMARSFVDATSSLAKGVAMLNGVPLNVTDGAGSADIALTRQGQGNWALEVDEYLARSPFDGLLTEVHFTVPPAPYSTAWVLCAVDPDPAKDPILTTRLTRYGHFGVGNNMLADTTITLPRAGEPLPEGVSQVGTVKRPGKADVPLYLVQVPLKTGQILDLANDNKPLDVDFFGKPWVSFQQIDNTSKPDPNSTSAVQIFGVTLEKSPVTLQMLQSQPGNIFNNDEKRVTSVVVKSLTPARGKLAWEIRDVDGKTVGRGDAAYAFDKAGEEQPIDINLDQPKLGWYELLISAVGEDGRILLTHPARFALLGKDRRKAKYDSPYGTWWFDGTHNTPSSLDFAGPIMFKAGIRKAAWTKLSEADMAKWSITKDQINMPFNFKDLKDPEKAKIAGKKKVDADLKKYPHASEVVVFHESGPGNDLPLELFGIKPEMTDALIQREKKYADLFNFAGEFFRKNYPQLKLVVGNNSASQSCIAAIFRHGGKPQYMDYIGIESPSQVFIPEKLQEWAIQGNHIATDTAKLLTGKDIPATGCYEFTYRCERDMGEQQQAEWYMRDILISLANGFNRIGPGILFDTANSYYNGLWGASGILQRGPWGYPKKSYVAYATLTNVLDQVKLRRQIPTGSTTVYALAFDRSDGKIVTVLWTARGEAELSLRFESATPVEVIDLYGRHESRPSADKTNIQGGTGPTYVVTDKPVAGITIAGRGFAKDAARVAGAPVVATFDSADALALNADHSLDTPLVAPLQTPVREQGRFELTQAKDERQGDVMELRLTPAEKPVSKYITEYTTLRLKQPAVVPGQPAALGVWVKGDSNWGRILFEIQDAKGEIWRSLGTGGWGCDILDWPGNLAVNFDGWNCVTIPLRESALFNDRSPGPVLEQWVSSGGDKRIDYPIRINALIVEMHRQPLDLIDFKPAKATIRIKDVVAIPAPPVK